MIEIEVHEPNPLDAANDRLFLQIVPQTMSDPVAPFDTSLLLPPAAVTRAAAASRSQLACIDGVTVARSRLSGRRNDERAGN